jgi:hypothetical protein
MRSPIFVFLGVTEPGTNANINTVKERLEAWITASCHEIVVELKNDLLTITLQELGSRSYISFVNNDHDAVNVWKDLARNFELPWDIKPVDKQRLISIYAWLGKNGWCEYEPFQQLGFTILEEMEKFEKVKVFTIPSMEKVSRWKRIF